MDLTKFYPENIKQLTSKDLSYFVSLTESDLFELGSKDDYRTYGNSYLVYVNKSNKQNPHPVYGSYSYFLEYLKKGDDVRIVCPSQFYRPGMEYLNIPEERVEPLAENVPSLKEFIDHKKTNELEEVKIKTESKNKSKNK